MSYITIMLYITIFIQYMSFLFKIEFLRIISCQEKIELLLKAKNISKVEYNFFKISFFKKIDSREKIKDLYLLY